MMHITFVNYGIPNVEHSTMSSSAFHWLEVLRNAGYRVSTVLIIPEVDLTGDGAACERRFQKVIDLGIEVHKLPACEVEKRNGSSIFRSFDFIRSFMAPKVSDFFSEVHLAKQMQVILLKLKPDAIFIWGSYAVAATHGTNVAPRFAFVGDPIHVPILYRAQMMSKTKTTLGNVLLKLRLRIKQRADMMLRVLSQCDGVAATASHHAQWIRENGIARCKYLPNMISDWGGRHWQLERRKRLMG